MAWLLAWGRHRRRSSVVERTLGKGEVECSIHSGGTIKTLENQCLAGFHKQGEILASSGTIRESPGDFWGKSGGPFIDCSENGHPSPLKTMSIFVIGTDERQQLGIEFPEEAKATSAHPLSALEVDNGLLRIGQNRSNLAEQVVPELESSLR
jgi:hypothetical protein